MQVDSPNAGSGVEIPISDLSDAPKFAENGNCAASDVPIPRAGGTNLDVDEPNGTRVFRLGAHCERTDCACRPLDNAEVVGPGLPPVHEGCDCVIEVVPPVPADFAEAAYHRGRNPAVAPNQVLVNALRDADNVDAIAIVAQFKDGRIGTSYSDCDPEIAVALARAISIAADRRLVDGCMETLGEGDDPTG